MHKNPRLVAIGKHIQRLRIDANFTQEKFAEKIEMDRSYYGRLERGEHRFSVLKLIDIAEALGQEIGAIMPKMTHLKRLKKE